MVYYNMNAALANAPATKYAPSATEKSIKEDVVDYLDYVNDVIKVKDYFYRNCKIKKTYEINKIWARWMITHLSTADSKDTQGDRIIMTNLTPDDDQQLLLELTGIGEYPNSNYQQFVGDFLKYVHDKLNKYADSSFKHGGTVEVGDPEEAFNGVFRALKWIRNKTYMTVKIRSNKYKKLHKCCTDRKQTDFRIWQLVWQYSILDGNSLQWAVPASVFCTLNREFELKAELFASPTNCFLPSYFSLFNSDRYFGSNGNFFNMKPGHLMLGGTYMVNPPFIEELFIKSSEILVQRLITAFENNVSLTLIYIMPNWLDSKGYSRLRECYFFRKELVLQANKHVYYETASESYIPAKFNTHMLVLSTNQHVNFKQDEITAAWTGS